MARILGKQLLQMPVFIGIAAILTFFSCKPAEPDTTSLKKEIVTAYAQVVFATYEDALTTAKLLQTAVDTLLNNPTELNLKAAQKSHSFFVFDLLCLTGLFSFFSCCYRISKL